MIPMIFQRLFFSLGLQSCNFGSEVMGTKKVCTPSYFPGILGDDHKRVFCASARKCLRSKEIVNKKSRILNLVNKNCDTKKHEEKTHHELELPPPSKSHHQDYSIFSRESQAKPSFVTMASWVGRPKSWTWLPTTFKTPVISPFGNPIATRSQEFQSPLAWHTEEECWWVLPWESAGNLILKFSSRSGWLEPFGGVKCWALQNFFFSFSLLKILERFCLRFSWWESDFGVARNVLTWLT